MSVVSRPHLVPTFPNCKLVTAALLPRLQLWLFFTGLVLSESKMMHWNDMGYGMGFGMGFGWLFGLLVLILVVLAIAALVKYLLK